jgi:integrase
MRDRFDKGMYKLGRTLSEAHRKFAELPIHEDGQIQTIGELFDRYEREVIPTNKTGTQDNKRRALVPLRKVFANSPLVGIEPQHIYAYFDAREKQSGNRTARAELEVIRHAYSMAVRWGLISSHPFKGEVRVKKNKPRDRYVEDHEIDLFYRAYASNKIRAYIDIKRLTGMSKQDILTIRMSDIRPDGLHMQRKKTIETSKRKVYEFDEAGYLQSAIDLAMKAHVGGGHIGSLYLFHTREGREYYKTNSDGSREKKPSAWDSMWQRRMKKFGEDGHQRFTDHDIRAKVASDTSLEHAQALLDHTNPNVTENVYRRAPKVIKVAKIKDKPKNKGQ